MTTISKGNNNRVREETSIIIDIKYISKVFQYRQNV